MKTEYPFLIRPLAEEEGGGYLIEYPDLPGCMSDGDTPEEAIKMGGEAVAAWIAAAKAEKRAIPKPGCALAMSEYSGKYVQRLPKSLHEALSKRAEREGVSLNALAMTYIAQGLGQGMDEIRRGGIMPPSDITSYDFFSRLAALPYVEAIYLYGSRARGGRARAFGLRFGDKVSEGKRGRLEQP